MQPESAVEENTLDKEVTRTTFHAARFWLKVAAALNALAMFDTEATFHLLMSALNVGLLANTEAMLVTAAVFHSTMLPYVVASPPIHAVTAAATLAFVMHVAHTELTTQA